MPSRICVPRRASGGNSPHPLTLSRTGWQSARSGALLERPRPCCMTKDCHYFFGQRHATLQSFCRTGIHIRCLDELHQRHSLARNQTFLTSRFLAVWFTATCLRRAERSWSLQQKKGIFVAYNETSKAYRVYM